MGRMWIRTAVLVAVPVAAWAADAAYDDAVLSPAAAGAAVRQVDGDGVATLRTVHDHGRWADGAAIGVTVAAAVVWLATLQVRPRTVFTDRRGQE